MVPRKGMGWFWAAVLVAMLGWHAYLTPARIVSGEVPSLSPQPSRAVMPSPGPDATSRPQLLHQDLRARIEPAQRRLAVRAVVKLPESIVDEGEVHFVLHRGMHPQSGTLGARLEKEMLDSLGLDGPLEAYRVVLSQGVTSFELEYSGVIDHPVEAYGEDYGRSFGRTPGMISDEAVYLSAASGWYPLFDDALLTFRLQVDLPPGWASVSQGARLHRRQDGDLQREVWEETHPQDGIFLLAGRFHEYQRPVGPIDAMVFLRAPDPALAVRYLEATEQYLEMYQDLLGPYPYRKFALVENFWETGYGMPSFTLLGPTVLRLPFILTSSYPHEILHNWWGNSVYVNYAKGNWSEGLTAYLSDHLIQELRGKGAQHRQTSLQKYADYVAADREFPLTAFRSRHGSASEAVGYTKMMLLTHMLRRELGDEVFIAGLRGFYRGNRFRAADFSDMEGAFATAAERSLGPFFRQWTRRAEVPGLAVRTAEVVPMEGRYRLRLVLEQTQAGPEFRLLVPLAVTLEGQEAVRMVTVDMELRGQEWSLDFPSRPLRLDVDPEFDLLRRLHPQEIPPALSGVFGASKVVAVLPRGAGADARRAYQTLVESWRSSGNVELAVRWDDALADLPVDAAVWLFGWENRLLSQLAAGLKAYSAALDAKGTTLPGLTTGRDGLAVALALRHPDDPARTVGVFAADLPDTIPALGRRLPHFHRNSYLAFQGPDARNTLKGRWPVVDSPLSIALAPGGLAAVPRGRLPDRPPLVAAPLIVAAGAGSE